MIGISGSRGPFVPYRTMFKLPVLGQTRGWKALPSSAPVRAHVLCVKCGKAFLLTDLLDSELEEDACPHCTTTADEYWDGTPSRPVPEYN